MTELLELSEARMLPQLEMPGGKFPSLVTLRRWVRFGVHGSDGQRIKLKTSRIGGRVFVDRRVIEQFLRDLNGKEYVSSRSSEEDQRYLESVGMLPPTTRSKPGPKEMKPSHRRLIALGLMQPKAR